MYGILIVLGIIIGSLVAERIAKKNSLNTDVLWEGLLIAVLTGIIGARLYHVLDLFEYYKANPIQIVQIQNGGLGILGGLLTASIAILLYAKLKKQPLLKWLDVASITLPLGQAIGRWGNYFNQELMPYAIYASFVNFGLFVLLYVFYKKHGNLGKGNYLVIYLVGFSLKRFLLEDLHQNGWVLGEVNMAKTISLVVIIAILLLYVISCLRSWRGKKEGKNS